ASASGPTPSAASTPPTRSTTTRWPPDLAAQALARRPRSVPDLVEVVDRSMATFAMADLEHVRRAQRRSEPGLGIQRRLEPGVALGAQGRQGRGQGAAG